jgi:hypothetical protein
MKVFISGSISIDKLPLSAIEKLDSIVQKNFCVLIGDAKGVDLQVQKYLCKKKYNNVIVYYVGEKSRHNIGKWKEKNICNDDNIKKGRELYTLKDIAMAKDADYGLMVWDGRSPGTLNNIKTMKAEQKRFYVILDGLLINDVNIDAIIDIQLKQDKVNKSQQNLF